MNPQKLSLYPSTTIKSKFTRRFLRALRRINKHPNRPTTLSSSSSKDNYLRYRSIKIAADASMAVAVGSRRAWSRAMLWKIRNQQRHRGLVRGIRRHGMKKRGVIIRENNSGRAKELRKLVPGGEAMDLCSLLGETAHYIKCLTTQVQVMRSIADLYST